MRAAVSVVVPVRNGAATVATCLRSILAAEIPYGGLEVIVVDNGSSDATASIVQSFPVRLLSAPDRPGSYYARNVGAAASSGGVLAFTDSDCEVDRRWLTAALPRFSDPEVGLVAGKIEAGPASTRAARYQGCTGALDQERTLRYEPMPYAQTANCLVRRQALEALGGFDENFQSGGDADLCWRLQMQKVWKLIYEPSSRVVHHHRSTWRGVFHQTMTHTRGLMALEEKYRDLYVGHAAPRRLEHGPLMAFGHAAFGLSVRGAALLWALLGERPDGAWQRFGDFVRSAAFHTAVCGRKLRIV